MANCTPSTPYSSEVVARLREPPDADTDLSDAAWAWIAPRTCRQPVRFLLLFWQLQTA
jgi:hypothetical protein